MPAPPQQAETAAFLQRLAGHQPIETHVSLVFPGADTAWKLKKAIKLPFLDFRNIEDRRHFTRRELELNKVAAPEMYRDVVPVVRQPDGSLGLGAPDDDVRAEAPAAVDWVLRMARVPEGDFLDAIAARRGLDAALLDAIADAVAAYHAALKPSAGLLPPMRDVALGNVPSARAAGLPEADVTAWRDAELAALDRLQPLLEERARAGFVRRTHGDLHLGNLCLWHGRPVPFDALEFDETLATIDLAYDVAFLLMDLDLRVGRAAANRVLNRYVARTGDVGLVATLPAFLSMRAMVRAHVEARTGHAPTRPPYLQAACAYLRPAPVVIVATGGLPGSGKSTLARALAPSLGRAPGALVLRSDEIRKRQHSAPPEQRLPEAAYSEVSHQAVLATLVESVRIAAAGGHSVIADATFIDPVWRRAIEDAATEAGAAFVGLWLDAPIAELERRIIARSGDASDATVAVLHRVTGVDRGPMRWHVLDAQEATGAAAAALEFLHGFQADPL